MFVNRHRINETHEHSSFIFAGRSDSRYIQPQTPEDMGNESIWVTQDELDDLLKNDKRLRDDIYYYASAALKFVS